ncbi:MAG: tRNA 2-thiouridine(34) synthase MnmA [Candidatus Caenarcaniphilales bacterium]|nr:tRNA 2-thiouridine(34) synthase MnmA [Candidatus Caenarcaniphilales bacterium]
MNKLIESTSLINLALKKVAQNNLMPPEGSSIGIAMSGGVDSSVAAALLSRMNYKVFGITGWLMEGAGKCCDSGMLDSARISETLNIEHHSIDLREYFNSTIISPFVSSYSVGRTPVPCMPCNTEVKWGSLLQSCASLGADYLASGHYARLIKHKDGRLSIGRSKDQNKDQSYMLWGLNQEQLSKTVFPLANFTKDEIRALAKEFELGNWDKEESQDICFIPNKTKDFLMDKLGERPGEIKEIKTGKVLGQHSGTHFYTVGQRKGIGLSSAEPIYVIKLDPINNIVYVGEKSELYSSGLEVEFANWQIEPSDEPAYEPIRAMVKIRYNADAVPALVVPVSSVGDSKLFKVKFDSEVTSVTPGQAAVAYDSENEFIIAGGWISRAID